jgi:flavin-dependent thymidylate synthase
MIEAGTEFKVLDHGYIKFIDSMGTDATIIEAARMSTGKGFQGWYPGEVCEDCGCRKDEKYNEQCLATLEMNHKWKKISGDMNLLDYLWRNKHTSPFEFCELHIEVNAPILVWRQWMRHRTQCLAGDTRLVFDLPGVETREGRETQKYTLTIKEVFEKFKPTQNVTRPDRQANSYFKRERVQGMRLRCVNEETLEPTYTSITDVWESGKKRVYDVVVKVERGFATIRCSADHRFFTPAGWRTLKELYVLPTGVGEEKIPGPDHSPLYTVEGVTKLQSSKEVLPIEADEQWRPVFHWEDWYEVSDMGRVRRVAGERALECKKLTCSKAGYLVTNLNRPGTQETANIHVLVLEAFSEPRPEGKECRHLDGNKWNNHLNNLCWGTTQENADDRVRHGSTPSLRTVARLPSLIKCVGEEMTYDIEVEDPWHNFVAEGFVVHNSYNEASARYSKMSEDHYLPTIDRFLPKKTENKQESSTIYSGVECSWEGLQNVVHLEQEEVYDNYEEFLKAGVPNEVARINTPVSRYSKARVKTDLKNWLGFLTLRMHPHAQWEIRQYAETLGREIVAAIWPRTWAIFEEHTLYGVHFSRTEMSVIKEFLTHAHNIFSPVGMKERAEAHGLKGSLLDDFLKKLERGGQEII